MSLTKQQLQQLNNTNFPNNTTGYITPALLRGFNSESVDSMALQTQVDSLSSSFQSQLNDLEDFSSSLVTNFATVAQLNTSSSVLQSNINGKASTGSVNTLSQSVYVGFSDQATINTNVSNRFTADELKFNQYTQSNDTAVAGKASLSQDNYFVGNQYVTGKVSVNGNISASGDIRAEGNVYGANLTGSFVSSSTFNSFSSSVDNRLDSLESWSSSLDVTYATDAQLNASSSTLQSNINTLSSSVFQTDATQSNNIASNSSSVGLLQTFSGSQYKADSASFSSRILAITGSSIDTGSLVTTSSFNAYTSSNDSKVNSLIAATASYVTSAITGSSLITASVSQSTITFTKGDGSTFNIVVADVSGSAGNFVTTASFNAYTSSQDFKNTTFATTGSNTFTGQQTLSNTGDLQFPLQIISGGIRIDDPNTDWMIWNSTANGGLKRSNTADLELLAQSASLNIRNDAGRVYISGSQILINDVDFIPFSSSLDSRINGLAISGNILVVQDEGTILGPATSMDFIGSGVTATISAGTASITITGGGGSIDTGSFATTGSNTFTGNQTIEGAIVSNPTTAVTKLFSQAFVSGAVQLNITASNAISQSNLVLVGTPLLASSTLTGSIIISGSNNILLNPVRTNTLATSFRFGYIGGSGNFVGTIPTLNTGSLVNPTMGNNQLNGAVTLTFNTSSTLANPTFNTNQIVGSTQINHQSGSAAFISNIVMNNGFTSTANTTTLSLNSTISGNLVASFGGVTLNHNSSSILYSSNIGGGISVTNNYSSSVSTTVDNVSVQGNLFTGTGHTLLVSGSNTSIRRTFNHNIIVGSTNAISSDFSGSSGGHLVATAVIGQNLIVSASGTSTTVGGGAFFGRYNDVTNMYADSGKMVFSVGTGTSTSNRKTALSVDSSSVVNVSGSLSVTGSSTFNGNMVVTGSLTASGTINGTTINNGDVTGSTFLATSNGTTAFIYNQQSTGSVAGVYNTNYGKDGLQVYQYQGQPYAFNVILTANQIAAYTGSEFQWGLQTNGTLSLPGGGSTYFAMSSGSTITGSGGGANKVGLDYLETAMIMDFKADTAFNRKVYVDKGMYVSQSVGGGKPALIVNGTNAASNLAIVATGSVNITGSLTLNGQTGFASLDSNTFTNTQIVSSSIYIAPNNNNNQLYLPSGSNKQTGLATLDGGNPGTVTVSNTNVTANSIIMLTKQTYNHPQGQGVSISSKGSGTFTITSNHNGDTDIVAFMIINPS
jgi:hypothetical protein